MNFPNLPTLDAQPRRAVPKGEPRTRVKGRKARRKTMTHRVIRKRVFDRDCFMCRCCLKRPAETMHEIVPRSLGGKVSLDNSVALCGDGVRGCHGFCQRYEIRVEGIGTGPLNASAGLRFIAVTPAALAQLGRPRVKSSPPDVMRTVLDDMRVTGSIQQKPRGTWRKQSHLGASVSFKP